MPLADPRHLTVDEFAALEARCARANMAIYSAPHLPAADKSLPKQLAQQLGLVHLEGNYLADEDGLSSITPADDDGSGVRGDFIPYTHKPINWHTDGYYNALDRRILGMTLHCAQDAESGGENALLDHEIAYIQLRDVNPDYVAALMQPEAMTIPGAHGRGQRRRPRAERTGVRGRPRPGFPVHALHRAHPLDRVEGRCRHTSRSEDARRHPGEFRIHPHRPFAPRHGPHPCNALHTRSGFSDSPDHRRLLYRGRYYDRRAFPAHSA